jgi:hypothetical protein
MTCPRRTSVATHSAGTANHVSARPGARSSTALPAAKSPSGRPQTTRYQAASAATAIGSGIWK